MAKFSVSRDEEEDDDEEEVVDEQACFVQIPKRRRTTNLNPEIPTSASTNINNNNNHNHNHNHAEEEQQLKFGVENEVEINSRVQSNNLGASISVILTDPEVLDCSICFEPLTIPVFQCDNGHVACSSCYNKLGDECPSRCGKIGKNRCFAIEKVIESVKVRCCYSKNGCEETVSYCKKHEHEEKCRFVPCLCPFTKCLFWGSARELSHHMYLQHADVVVGFCYNSEFAVVMGTDENFLVLQEENDGTLFILSHGDTVAIRCITSNSSEDRFKYDIVLRKGCSSLKFQSSTHSTIGQLSVPPSADYVTVPGCFYNTGGRVKLEICVWSKDGRTR